MERMFEMKGLEFFKKYWKSIVVAILALFLGNAIGMGSSSPEYESVVSIAEDLDTENAEYKEQIKELETQIKEKDAKIKEAEPFFKLQEEERIAKEAEAKAAEEKRLAEEKAKQEEERKKKEAAEAEAKRLAEEEEKKGYDTGITYEQLARTPDNYKAKKVKFRGKVVQVIEGSGTTQIRFAVNEDYDNILFGEFDSSTLEERVLEDDIITIMGKSAGLITYESTMGGQISIPGVSIEKVDR